MVRASSRKSVPRHGATDGRGVSKGSNQGASGLPAGVGVALLRPRLLPLSAEQRAEAVALLSELLLAAARESAAGLDAPKNGAKGPGSRRRFAAGELGRRGRAA